MAVTSDISGYLNKIKFTLLSTTAGVDTEVTTSVFNAMVVQAIFIPGASTDAPDAAWDVTVTDADSVDILGGLGADLSASATTYKFAKDGLGYVKSSALTCNASGMGEANTGTVILYLLDVDKA
jgi:hypothetical protein